MSSRRSNTSGSRPRPSSNTSASVHRPSPSQSSSSVYSGYSDVSSVQEIVRPGANAGPRPQTSSRPDFYSMPGGVADLHNVDRVNRQPSSSSIQAPPYTAQPPGSRPPSYQSRTSSDNRRPSTASSVHPASHASDPPSYHSRPPSQVSLQGPGQPQQPGRVQTQQQQPQQPQQHLAPPQPPQQRQGWRQRTSETLRNFARRNRDRR